MASSPLSSPRQLAKDPPLHHDTVGPFQFGEEILSSGPPSRSGRPPPAHAVSVGVSPLVRLLAMSPKLQTCDLLRPPRVTTSIVCQGRKEEPCRRRVSAASTGAADLAPARLVRYIIRRMLHRGGEENRCTCGWQASRIADRLLYVHSPPLQVRSPRAPWPIFRTTTSRVSPASARRARQLVNSPQATSERQTPARASVTWQ